MSEFEKHGFLAIDSLRASEEMQRQCGDYLSLLRELNERAQEVQYSLEVRKNSLPQLLSAILYSRLLSSYQAAIILCEKGMKSQGNMLLRAVIESLFPLVATSKDSNFAERYRLADHTSRLNSLNKLIDYKTRNKERDDNLAQAKEQKTIIEQEIEDNDIQPLSTEACAIAADMHDWYQLVYPLVSLPVHSSIRSLIDHVEYDRNTLETKELKNEPDLEGMSDTLSLLAQAMISGIDALCKVFAIKSSDYLDITKQKLSKLDGNQC
jgi:hypothetical protein